MAEENGAAEIEKAQPQFIIQKIYTKDISFETPNSPEIFREDHISSSCWQTLVDVATHRWHVRMHARVGLDVRDGQIQFSSHWRQSIQKSRRFVDVALVFVALVQSLDDDVEVLAAQWEWSASRR